MNHQWNHKAIIRVRDQLAQEVLKVITDLATQKKHLTRTLGMKEKAHH
jgi:hypothetical protein